MAKGRAPRRRTSVTVAMYDRLLNTVEANHAELIELRKIADASLRRCAELQAEVDRLKKLVAGKDTRPPVPGG